MSLMAGISCSSDSPVTPDDAEVPDMPCYLELLIKIDGSSGTRTESSGDDENWENGREKENKIHNLNIFVYFDRGTGLDGNNQIIWSRYLTKDSLTYIDEPQITPTDKKYTVRVRIKEDEVSTLSPGEIGRLRTIVIANAGKNLLDESDLIPQTNSLSKFTGYTSAWTGETVQAADNFLMSNAYSDDGVLRSFTSTEEKDMRYYGEITLERVAARIDLLVEDGENIPDKDGEKCLHYDVADTSNTLILKNAIPVNLMQNNSYLIKQVSKGEDTDQMLAAGIETRLNGIPTNYVMSPDFKEKPSASEEFKDSWFGDSSASNLAKMADSVLETKYSLDHGMISSAYQFEGAGSNERAIVLTYANENTHHMNVQMAGKVNGKEYQPSDYLTGLLLRAQYRPGTLYADGACTKTTEYVDETDFWMYRPVSKDMAESSNRYFSTEKALEDYIAGLPEGTNYETQKYDKGICYYNIWIKHNTKSDENYPMKYGIVRNTIYRISFRFNGIGHPKPDISEPFNVTSRIFVTKWNFRLQPEIIM